MLTPINENIQVKKNHPYHILAKWSLALLMLVSTVWAVKPRYCHSFQDKYQLGETMHEVDENVWHTFYAKEDNQVPIRVMFEGKEEKEIWFKLGDDYATRCKKIAKAFNLDDSIQFVEHVFPIIIEVEKNEENEEVDMTKKFWQHLDVCDNKSNDNQENPTNEYFIYVFEKHQVPTNPFINEKDPIQNLYALEQVDSIIAKFILSLATNVPKETLKQLLKKTNKDKISYDVILKSELESIEILLKNQKNKNTAFYTFLKNTMTWIKNLKSKLEIDNIPDKNTLPNIDIKKIVEEEFLKTAWGQKYFDKDQPIGADTFPEVGKALCIALDMLKDKENVLNYRKINLIAGMLNEITALGLKRQKKVDEQSFTITKEEKVTCILKNILASSSFIGKSIQKSVVKLNAHIGDEKNGKIPAYIKNAMSASFSFEDLLTRGELDFLQNTFPSKIYTIEKFSRASTSKVVILQNKNTSKEWVIKILNISPASLEEIYQLGKKYKIMPLISWNNYVYGTIAKECNMNLEGTALDNCQKNYTLEGVVAPVKRVALKEAFGDEIAKKLTKNKGAMLVMTKAEGVPTAQFLGMVASGQFDDQLPYVAHRFRQMRNTIFRHIENIIKENKWVHMDLHMGNILFGEDLIWLVDFAGAMLSSQNRYPRDLKTKFPFGKNRNPIIFFNYLFSIMKKYGGKDNNQPFVNQEASKTLANYIVSMSRFPPWFYCYRDNINKEEKSLFDKQFTAMAYEIISENNDKRKTKTGKNLNRATKEWLQEDDTYTRVKNLYDLLNPSKKRMDNSPFYKEYTTEHVCTQLMVLLKPMDILNMIKHIVQEKFEQPQKFFPKNYFEPNYLEIKRENKRPIRVLDQAIIERGWNTIKKYRDQDFSANLAIFNQRCENEKKLQTLKEQFRNLTFANFKQAKNAFQQVYTHHKDKNLTFDKIRNNDNQEEGKDAEVAFKDMQTALIKIHNLILDTDVELTTPKEILAKGPKLIQELSKIELQAPKTVTGKTITNKIDTLCSIIEQLVTQENLKQKGIFDGLNSGLQDLKTKKNWTACQKHISILITQYIDKELEDRNKDTFNKMKQMLESFSKNFDDLNKQLTQKNFKVVNLVAPFKSLKTDINLLKECIDHLVSQATSYILEQEHTALQKIYEPFKKDFAKLFSNMTTWEIPISEVKKLLKKNDKQPLVIQNDGQHKSLCEDYTTMQKYLAYMDTFIDNVNNAIQTKKFTALPKLTMVPDNKKISNKELINKKMTKLKEKAKDMLGGLHKFQNELNSLCNTCENAYNEVSAYDTKLTKAWWGVGEALEILTKKIQTYEKAYQQIKKKVGSEQHKANLTYKIAKQCLDNFNTKRQNITTIKGKIESPKGIYFIRANRENNTKNGIIVIFIVGLISGVVWFFYQMKIVEIEDFGFEEDFYEEDADYDYSEDFDEDFDDEDEFDAYDL